MSSAAAAKGEGPLKNYGAFSEFSQQAHETGDMVLAELDRYRRMDLSDLMHEIYGSRHRLFYMSVMIGGFLYFLLATYAWYIENWSFFNSLYYATMTVTSIGYGDLNAAGGQLRWVALAACEAFGAVIVGTFFSVALVTLILNQDEEDAMRVVPIRTRLYKCLLFAFVLATTLGTFVATVENWSVSRTIFWVADTVTTTGNGFVAPTTKAGRVGTMLFMIGASPILLIATSALISFPRALLLEENRSRVFADAQASHSEIPNPHFSASTSRDTFALKLLIEAHLVHPDDVRETFALYDEISRASSVSNSPRTSGYKPPTLVP